MKSPLYVPRDEFISEYWDWRRGEHVTILGPTDSGKTYLAFDLLRETVSPQRRAVVLVAKPQDETVAKLAYGKGGLGLRRVQTWPPVPTAWQPGHMGWVLHPRHTFDPDRDDWILETRFRAALRDSYKRGKRIVFADEVSNLIEDLHLRKELKAIWKRGRSQDAALLAVDQRPAWLPREAYSQAAHLFLGNTADETDRKNYAQIGGGVDRKLVESVVVKLPKRHFLYVKRYGPRGATLCIVGD